MEIPLCLICAKTGVLCRDCEKKLATGRISLLDVSFAKLLFDLGLGDVGFERAVEGSEHIIVLAKKEDVGRLIGRGGENIRTLTERLGKKVKVMGSENLEDAIHDFIAPARVASIHKAYLSDGSLMRKIKINKGDKARLRMGIKEIEALVSSLTPEKIEISFSE